MTKYRKPLPLFFLAIAVLAIIISSTGLAELTFQPGKSLNLIGLLLQELRGLKIGSSPGAVGGGDSPMDVLAPLFWISLLFSIVYAIISPRFRRQLLRTFFIALSLVLILSLLLQGSEREEEASTLERGTTAPEGNKITLPDPPPLVKDPPPWLLAVLDISLVLLFSGMIWFFWRLLRSAPDTQTLLVQEAELALADLKAGSDLRNVVMRCYVRMSQVLRQSQGIARNQAMTPREFESHLAEIGLRNEHIERLTRLFEGVRYGAKPSGGRAEREAVDCLTAIIQAYG